MLNIDSFVAFLEDNKPLVVLTGAGISAASGIPTYRDSAGNWNRSDPIKHQEFINSEAMRQRYWARSMIGWKAITTAVPNSAHKSLAKLEQQGFIKQIITQNVDGLHNLAGSAEVVDLHGRLDRVICLNCAGISTRQELQPRLHKLNPDLKEYVAELLPDGDANIDDYPTKTIKIPTCTKCGGALKPDVVFFGDNVPKERVKTAMDSLTSASGLLIVGSSLQVYSGYRFCKAASEHGIPIGCINQGITRADHLFSQKWEEDCAQILNKACAQIFDF